MATKPKPKVLEVKIPDPRTSPNRAQIATAILRVKLGESGCSVAEEVGMPQTSLARLVRKYERPSGEVIVDLLAEFVVNKLSSGVLPAEVSAVVTASKIVLMHSEGTPNLTQELESYGKAANV